jgi:predicted subunit of tRNA(5-methylaminomethyl-2-thiouridylate) methyltransferase|tara:strand:+ start:711 stop:944 length:234 start_codon:yes stop_codon:yes gene_type:complete
MDIQLTLTILLIIIELVAFAWLIIDIQKSKKKQDKIIELEYQILKVEHQILKLENNILDMEKNIIIEIVDLKKKLIK